MLADRDPNGSGRTSRASNLSAMSRATGQYPHGAGKPDLLPSAAPGVMSMLRTSTEMGNLPGFTGDMSGMGMNPRAQRRGASSRLSTASSLSNNSSRTSKHHRQWPSSSSAVRRSSTREPNVPQYMPDTLSPTMMNIPGSSPLVPMPHDRDSHRSHSMTHTMQPNFRLSSNRSLGSLRHEQIQQQIQRPRSPYHYPTRLRRPNHRPASPPLSDITGSHTGRQHGHGRQGQPYYPDQSQGQPYYPGQSQTGQPYYPGQSQAGQPYYPGQSQAGQPYYPGPTQGQPCYPGQMRPRGPLDPNFGHQDRAHRMHRRPSRGTSSAYYSGPRPDIPPVPPVPQHHIAVEQARMLHRSTKGSVSSGSTNLRTDSDAPSSDMASPPTPKDGASMEVLISPNGTQTIVDTVTGAVKDESTGGPLYYDYSEQFDHGHSTDPEADPVPTGFVTHIKTIIEERGSPPESALKTPLVPGFKVSVEVVRPDIPDIAELPASPVPRRITRELILKAIEPSSTTGDMDASRNSPALGSDPESEHTDTLPVEGHSLSEETAGASLHPEEGRNNRHSILSQTGSSVLDSSTLDFAVRYSIPMATSAGFGTDHAPEHGSEPASPLSAERSTEDGMSELLAGYQHTESKQGSDVLPQVEETRKKESVQEEHMGTKSDHAPKSSEEQSFKSCTNRSDLVSEIVSRESEQDPDAKSFRSATEILPEREPSVKEADARSSKTCTDATTADRAASMPLARLPSSNLAKSVHQKRPVSERLSSSPPVFRTQPSNPMPVSSAPIVASKLKASSKPSTKEGSMSMSGSSSTLSVTQHPPSVPPRESSSSKEAQRYQAVASFLIRQLPSRFAKVRKSTKDEGTPGSDTDDQSMSEPTHSTQESSSVASSSQLPFDAIQTPERALTKQKVVFEEQMAASIPSKVISVVEPPALHQLAFSSPSPIIQEPSSMYSPQDISYRAREQSSPRMAPRSPEHSRRDSQTTTHLAWHGGRRSLNIPAVSVSEPHLPLASVQEDTTTDLRLSTYRYHAPSRYLPDVKEESHEDSSLNTSASNLKNSHFRFPLGGPPGARVSVDDAIMYSRRSSTGSHRHSAMGSALGQTHGLPSMEFSHMNLIEKLNEELGLRCSRSLEGLSSELQVSKEGSPPRPASAREAREKYRSLVAELNDELKKPGVSAQSTVVMDLIVSKRACTPGLLMAELDQLSIPSVGGLTQRLSELIPSLREYYKLGEKSEFIEEDVIMEHAMDEIHEIGGPTQKRSSARLRPVAGSPNMVVINDALYEELTSKDKEHGSPDRQDDSAGALAPGEAGSDAKRHDGPVTHTQTQHNTVLTEIQTPPAAVLRPRSLTVGHQDLRASVESEFSSRRSLRSFVSTPTATDTRPWNSDKNYPWATTTIPSVDISLPPLTAARHSPRPGPSHLRNRLPNRSTSSSFSSANTATASPFGTATGSNAHARHHRFSVFGCPGDQPHPVGERYPTSALTPPTAIFRDHSSTLDTSDDEDFNPAHKSKLGLRKRFSSARNATLDNSTRAGRSKTNPLELASPESNQQSTTSTLQDRAGEATAFTAHHRHTFRDAEGMPVGTYHCNKVIDHLKKWWHKGGNLIRNLSRRSRTDPTTV